MAHPTNTVDISTPLPDPQEARRLWLASLGNPRTAKAYRQDLDQFLALLDRSPWQATPADVTRWQQQLTRLGYQPSTINRKLAAVNSFYRSVQTHVAPGLPNPAKETERPSVDVYAASRPLQVEDVRRALAHINRRTKTGARDYAVIIAAVYTGRTAAELAPLQWQDLAADARAHRVYYTWTAPDGVRHTHELPQPVWHAIRHFLTRTGRLETMQPDDYIFQPVCDLAHQLPNVEKDLPHNRPISSAMINRIVKRRFAAVGLDPKQVTAQTLRHTAVALRWRGGDGEDAQAIGHLLNHGHLRVTRAYLGHLRPPLDRGWTAVEEQIAIPAE